jgi:hypothetical protein
MEGILSVRKHPFTGLLSKPIHLNDAKPGWLKREFALRRDRDDVKAFAIDEYDKRLAAFDLLFRIDSRSADCWGQRVKALLAHKFGINSKEPWETIFWYLAPQHVPGFIFKLIGQKKRGRPSKWTDELLAQLFADVEFLKRKRGLSVSNICRMLPTKSGYERRWKGFKGAALRNAYLEAKKRRQILSFEFFLCGPHAVLSPTPVDLIEATIKLHALKL